MGLHTGVEFGFGDGQEVARQQVERTVFFRRPRHPDSMILLSGAIFVLVLAAGQTASQPPAPSEPELRQQEQQQGGTQDWEANPQGQTASIRPNTPESALIHDEAERPNEQREESSSEPSFDWRRDLPNWLIVIVTLGIGIVAYHQWREMIRSSTAAETAAIVAKQTAKQAAWLHRPFVTLAEYRWFYHAPNVGADYTFSFEPVFVNTGPLPTRELRIVTQYRLLDAMLPAGYEFPIDYELGPAFLGPTAKASGVRGWLNAADLAAVQAGTRQYYIYGIAEYRDGFETSPLHRTRFCAKLYNITGTVADPVATHMQIGFYIHPEHNDAT